jgi:hypothetical protein
MEFLVDVCHSVGADTCTRNMRIEYKNRLCLPSIRASRRATSNEAADLKDVSVAIRRWVIQVE